MAATEEIVAHRHRKNIPIWQENFWLADEVELLFQFELRAAAVGPEMNGINGYTTTLQVLNEDTNAVANEVVVMLQVVAEEHVTLRPDLAINETVADDGEDCCLDVRPKLTLRLVRMHMRVIHSKVHEHDNLVRFILQPINHLIELLGVEVCVVSVREVLDEVILEQLCELCAGGLFVFLDCKLDFFLFNKPIRQ